MSIDKRPSGQYRARWRELPGGPQKTATFDRKIDAQRHLTAMNAALLHGTYVDPAAGKVRVKEYALRWADQQPWRQSSRERTMSVLDKHVIPRFGALELRAVKPTDVRSWVGEMTKTLAPTTVESYYRVLVAVMRSAVVDKLISESPCGPAVKLPRRESSTSALVPLTVEQVHTIASAVPDRLRALVFTSAGLGLRKGEACGLTRDRVDFLRRRVTIDRQLICNAREVPSLAPPKTPASVRTVPLPDVVGEVLAQHIAAYNVEPGALLFTMDDGRPVRRSSWGHIFRNATDLVKIDATSHDLRHHAASLLISKGCSVKAVQSFLGHATAAETLDTYGHLWPDDDDRIRASIDAAYRAESSLSPAVSE